MSLRTRLAISVAALVAVAIGLSGWIAVNAAEQELIEEIDTFLEGRADSLGVAPFLQEALQPEGRRGGGFGDRRRFGFDSLSRDDAITQVVTADGNVLTSGEVVLPVGDAQLRLTREGQRPQISTLSVDGTDYRVITSPLGRDVAVMVGRDLSEVERALDGLTRRTFILGLIGSAAAALIAWLLASRLSRPIGRLTLAAEHVAETQELSASIEVESNDEVGRLATSFNTMLEALDTSREQQRRLVMDASHELRTPLTSLRTNVDVLRRARTLDVKVRDEVLTDVSSELDELTALVTELVELATTSRLPDEPTEPVALGGVVEAVAERTRRRTSRALHVELRNPATVDGHRAGLERAVSNLVDNALKFSPSDSAVTIMVDGARVSVRDRGPGIAPEDRAHVFDRFYRAPATRSQPGSGLGLSIVKDIVAAHHGQVHIDDTPDGAGASIGFTLPTGSTV